jgi:hypothetical protein
VEKVTEEKTRCSKEGRKRSMKPKKSEEEEKVLHERFMKHKKSAEEEKSAP